MPRPKFERDSALTLLLIVVALLIGCGSANFVDLAFGGLRVDTVTTGTNVDPNAYNLRVNGPSLNVEQTIGLNDQVIFTVTPGASR